MSKVDLHVHTNASDGRFSPAEIVHKSAECGLQVIAITDHDTLDGIYPALIAARDYPEITVVPGVEISTDSLSGEVHILGYFIDYENKELKAVLDRLRHSRVRRAEGMVDKLNGLGVLVEWKRVQEIAKSSSIGRPHIAQAMLEKGYIKSIKEAFTGYIERNGPAYVERGKITQVEAVELIQRAEGMAVLAHPLTIKDPKAIIIELKAKGLAGIEAYYNDYSKEQVDGLLALADKFKLIATGGSDFHGLDITYETMLGAVNVPREAAKRLIDLAQQRTRSGDSGYKC